MILQEILSVISGFKRVHQKNFHTGIKHGPSGWSKYLLPRQHSRLQIHLRQHHRRSYVGLLSNVISIRLLLCIFSDSSHKPSQDRYPCWIGNAMTSPQLRPVFKTTPLPEHYQRSAALALTKSKQKIKTYT